MKTYFIISILVWFSCLPIAILIHPFIGILIGGIGLMNVFIAAFLLFIRAVRRKI